MPTEARPDQPAADIAGPNPGDSISGPRRVPTHNTPNQQALQHRSMESVVLFGSAGTRRIALLACFWAFSARYWHCSRTRRWPSVGRFTGCAFALPVAPALGNFLLVRLVRTWAGYT